METLLNDTQESEDKLDTSRSSASEDAVVSPRSKDSTSSPRVPFALHIDVDNNKENEKGEKSTTPNSRSSATTTTQNKNTNNTKKPKTPTETPSLRAPYAQPVLDASKLHNNESKKSTTEERLASARGRRLQQQKQFELDLKSRREREDQAYAKWMQTQEEKRRKIEENKMKDGAHRREVEQRKKMQLEEDKKKAEAKIAKAEQQVNEVKMRQKRSASSDRTKRWSWGAGADDPSDQLKSGSLSNLASPSASKSGDERFSKSPLLINTTHMAFASGLRSYEPNTGAGRGVSPGRTHTSPGLTEPITISPRLLAPTRASLARSRNAINDLDDNTSQSSTGSGSHGPMRSRSKDRRVVKETQTGRSESGSSSPRVDGTKSTPPLRKPTPERKSTPTRGSSPMVPNRRAPSPAKKPATASSGSDSKTTATKSATENDKVKKRGVSPHARPYRAPSPAKAKSTTDLSTPPRTAPRRGASPSPATSRTKTKVQNDPKPVSTPPSIKPSLRPTTSTQLKTKSSSPSTKTSVQKTTVKPAAAKVKQDTPKQVEKPKDVKETKDSAIKNSNSDSGFQDNPTPSTTDSKSAPLEAPKVEGTPEIPKSSSNTSQAVSEIPTSEAEDYNTKERPLGEAEAEQDVMPSDAQESGKDKPQAGGDALIVIKDPSLDQDASSVPQDTTKAGGDGFILTKDSSQNQDVSSINEDEPSVDKDSQPESSLVKVDSPQIVDETTELKIETEAAPESLKDGNVLRNYLVSQPLDSQDVALTRIGNDAQTPVEAKTDGGDKLLLAFDEDEAKDSLETESGTGQQNSLLDSFQTVEPIDPRAVSPTDSLEEYEPESDVPIENSLQNELDSAEYPPPDNFDSEESDSEEQVSVKERIPNQEPESPTPEPQILGDNASSNQPKDEPIAENDSEDHTAGGQLPIDVETNEERPVESHLAGSTSADSQVTDQHLEEHASSSVNPQPEENPSVISEIPSQEDSVSENVQEETDDVDKIEPVVDQEIPQKEDEEAMEKNSGLTTTEDSQEDIEQNGTNDTEVLAQVSIDEKTEAESESAGKSTGESDTKQSVDEQKPEDVQTSAEAELPPVNEKKSQPRKNLETDEEKEAYRQAIAEKRRELKEKKEQEERERQERIRLAKIEQAKREEEARRMFEEAEATAELEKKMREEEAKRIEEEERRKEEEANAKKREAAEKVKRDREAAKQKQEDERLARKKRLEMIMRRTRQPEASDSDKPKTDGSLTPSPQHTPTTQSPAAGRSPQTQSPVGGISPLTATTPERSVSPAIAAILNRSNDTSSPTSFMTSQSTKANDADTNGQNLLNFSNSTKNFDTGVELIKIDSDEKISDSNIEKPVPFEAFTVKPLANGVLSESDNYSNNKDPFNLFSNESQELGQQSTVNQDLLSINNDLIQQKTEPLVPTGI